LVTFPVTLAFWAAAWKAIQISKKRGNNFFTTRSILLLQRWLGYVT